MGGVSIAPVVSTLLFLTVLTQSKQLTARLRSVCKCTAISHHKQCVLIIGTLTQCGICYPVDELILIPNDGPDTAWDNAYEYVVGVRRYNQRFVASDSKIAPCNTYG